MPPIVGNAECGPDTERFSYGVKCLRSLHPSLLRHGEEKAAKLS